ncbi:MAG: alpha/beta hydrolase [Chloroflexi bacterium]|nr:alpha/beta hydrolase [Chloroflexota bacterium]
MAPPRANPVAVRGRTLEIDGRRIFLREAAPVKPTARSLVLLHGWIGTSSWMYRHVLTELGRRFRTVVPDLPGFGRSQTLSGRASVEAYTRFVEHLVDALGIDRFHLVGASVGGTIALSFAHRFPERVEKLVLQGPVYRGSDLPQRFHMLYRIVDLPGVVELVPKAPIKWWFLIRRLDFGRDTRHLLPEDRRLLTRDILGVPNHTLVNVGRELLRIDLSDTAGNVCVPTLILDGADARLVPASASRHLHRLIPDSRCHIVPDCGHNLVLERPQVFLDLALPFLEEGKRALRKKK